MLGEQAWAAREAVVKAEAATTAVDKAVAAKKSQVKAAQDQVAAAVKDAEKAAAEKTAAEQALNESNKKTPDAQAESEATANEQQVEAKKILEQKTAASRKADEAVVAAKQAAEKASAEQADAEKLLAEEKVRLTSLRDVAGLAHAEALGGLKPITSQQWDYAKARHLLFRAGFGGTPEEVQKLVDMGPHKAVEYLVEYQSQPVANIELNILAWERPLAYEEQLHGAAQNRLAEQDERRDATQHAALVDWWVKRLAESPRPLEEKLVLFWHDHFASSYLTLRNAYMMYQQNQFFLHYADNFDALLHGIVQDPAMIQYLNNNENVTGNNNENLGREVLELFSIGEENSAAHKPDGYTETDVRDANTRALTGATFERYSGQFRFHAVRHDSDPKTLLGKTGDWGPHEAVDVILEHPATARYLAKKLWQNFVRWEPDPEAIERLAHVLRQNGYRIRPVLSNMFLSEQFYSDQSMASHIKSPIELLVGTAKIVNLSKPKYADWRYLLSNMGQALFDPPSVAGWPEGRHWINANLLMLRYTSVADLVKSGGIDFVGLLKKHKLESTDEVVDHLVQRCLLVNLSPEKRQALIDGLGPLPPSSQWDQEAKAINAKLQEAVMLLLSSPEYQVS
ncbi:MAG: DUF1800 family protein [Planctomycetia bacterium]|nr:DUF1800 family protein [Planctomycetia bacterium]